ncbi:MAG: flagellar filament capping protein FliD, partial [Thermotaleaceae bacterium]
MSVMRLSGLASGIDTESMIKNMMKVQRMKVDKFSQNKQLMQWRQEQYNSVNKDFANFVLDIRKEMELTKSTLSGVSYKNSMSNLSWVKKATSSNDSIFTASATTAAPGGIHTLKVHNLAEGVSVASQDRVEAAKGMSTTLAELGFTEDSGTIDFEVDGKTITVNYEKGDTISKFISNINNASKKEGDKTISLGLQASFDAASGRFFLSTKGTGEQAQIKITADDKGILTGENNLFKLKAITGKDMDGNPIYGPLAVVNTNEEGLKGKNAVISYNGAENIEYASNQFTINGIQINLKAMPASASDTFTIKVDTDVDGVYDKIKTFVDKYNELIDKMNGTISEKRYRSYLPLTSEQRESLSEKEIELWEEKAKSGLLAGDQTINRTLLNMRNSLYDEVKGDGISSKYNYLFNIGITTGDFKSKGKLEIDETKLKAAIADDVDGVLNLFFKEYTVEDGDSGRPEAEMKKKAKAGMGLFNRLVDDIVVGMKEMIDKSGTGTNA